MAQKLIMVSKVKQGLFLIVILFCTSVSIGCARDNIIKIDIEEVKQFKEIAGIDLYMALPVVKSNTSRQGCAFFDGILFIFHDTNDVVEIYDLKEKSLIGITDMTSSDLYNKEYHCNNANFSSYKFCDSDFFPLLYVSMENINQRKIIVLRISVEEDKYSFEQVQTIQLPFIKDLNLYYPNSYIDTSNDEIWVSGYTINNYNESLQNRLRYIKFRLPNFKGEKKVTLGTADVIQECEYDSISSTQGGVFYNGKLYQVFGIVPPLYLKIFDFHNELISYSSTISDYSQAEPEGLFIVDNQIYYSSEAQIFRIILN